MKKHLIAAAVAGAFAVPAMAQVTVSGTLLYDFLQNSKTTTTAGSTTTSAKTTQTGALNSNSWTAAQISISGSEDLGGGLKASFVANVDIRHGNATGWGPTRDQNLALSGGFGTVRVGRFVPASAMAFHGYSGAASTTFGSIYSLGALGASAAATPVGPRGAENSATTTAVFTAGSFERNENLIQYTSPSISGLTVNVSIGQNSSDASSANSGKTEVRQQGLSATYVAGPLSVGLGMNERNIKAEGTGAASGAKVNGDLNWIGASYNLGVATVSATQVRREDKSTAASTGVITQNADVTINSIGVAVPLGAITLAASLYDGDNEGTGAAGDTVDLSGHQISARYALSKRTTLYALFGENKIKRASGNTTSDARKATGNIIGVMHSF